MKVEIYPNENMYNALAALSKREKKSVGSLILALLRDALKSIPFYDMINVDDNETVFHDGEKRRQLLDFAWRDDTEKK